MRLVIQKVSQAAVTSTVEGKAPEVAEITRGLCVLVGFENGDTSVDCLAMSKQLLKLRLFHEPSSESGPGRTYAANLAAAKQDVLLVSQFTLNAVLKSGRPSFHRALGPEKANTLFAEFAKLCQDGLREAECVVKSGIFGSYMQLHLVNDGPFTICMTCTDGKCTTW